MSDAPEIKSRQGAKFLMVLPDEGPWTIIVYQNRALTLSQTSGLYEIEGVTLHKIELTDKEPNDA